MNTLNYGTYYSLNYISVIADGDSSFVHELTTTFVSQTPKMVNDLRLAILANNHELTCYLSHKLKSSCEVLEMSYAAGICLKIELAAINKRNLVSLIDDYEVLEHQLSVSTHELNLAAA